VDNVVSGDINIVYLQNAVAWHDLINKCAGLPGTQALTTQRPAKPNLSGLSEIKMLYILTEMYAGMRVVVNLSVLQ
jgi:hypothetical protein